MEYGQVFGPAQDYETTTPRARAARRGEYGNCERYYSLPLNRRGLRCATRSRTSRILPQVALAAARPITNSTPARAYAGHTGSPLDEPAKTLKAGDHRVPGGENMLAYADGSVRYFTVRESARIQSFPDTYAFAGSWTEAMRQLGNAVPVRLASAVARSIAARLLPGAL